MNIYIKLYKATGRKIQQAKIMFYCWRWKYVKGKQQIEQLEATIVVYGEEIKAINITESTRILSMYLNPALY